MLITIFNMNTDHYSNLPLWSLTVISILLILTLHILAVAIILIVNDTFLNFHYIFIIQAKEAIVKEYKKKILTIFGIIGLIYSKGLMVHYVGLIIYMYGVTSNY